MMTNDTPIALEADYNEVVLEADIAKGSVSAALLKRAVDLVILQGRLVEMLESRLEAERTRVATLREQLDRERLDRQQLEKVLDACWKERKPNLGGTKTELEGTKTDDQTA